MKSLILLTSCLAITACASSPQYQGEAMYDMASVLKDIAQSVDGELKFGDTQPLSKAQVVQNAMADNQGKLSQLEQLARKAKVSDYRILYDFQQDHAVVLVCDDDIALMEDAGCNAEFDKVYWHQPQNNSCEFHLDAQQLCGP